MTDLWPVRGTGDRLFLNARKMHSLPFERTRGNVEGRRGREKREGGTEKDETGERKTRERVGPSSMLEEKFISLTAVCRGQEKRLLFPNSLRVPRKRLFIRRLKYVRAGESSLLRQQRNGERIVSVRGLTDFTTRKPSRDTNCRNFAKDSPLLTNTTV